MESKAGSKFLFSVRLYRKTASHFSGRTLAALAAEIRVFLPGSFNTARGKLHDYPASQQPPWRAARWGIFPSARPACVNLGRVVSPPPPVMIRIVSDIMQNGGVAFGKPIISERLLGPISPGCCGFVDSDLEPYHDFKWEEAFERMRQAHKTI
jgi:hypothetical protein